MKIGFIGAGKVGFTLGKYLTTHGKEVTGYYSRSTQSAREAAEFTTTNVYEDAGSLIEISDVIFLTVPDAQITPVFCDIKKHDIKDKLICHCSGALSAAKAFEGIEETGALGYSVHPLFAVSDRYKAYKELDDVFFAVEGSEERIGDIEGMLKSAWLHVQRIESDSKVEYHRAASTVSNLMNGLVKQGVDTLVKCGFSADDALDALSPLIKGNVQHIIADGLVTSLTGPIERGDEATIRKHLDSFADDDDKMLYVLLALKVTDIAAAKHEDRDYSKIKKILEDAKC